MNELNEFKHSEFWQNILKDAKTKASKGKLWKSFDNPNDYHVPNAKESSRSVYIEWALDELFHKYNMKYDYLTAETVSNDEELELLQELKQKIKDNPIKYNTWKNLEKK